MNFACLILEVFNEDRCSRNTKVNSSYLLPLKVNTDRQNEAIDTKPTTVQSLRQIIQNPQTECITLAS